MPGTITFRPIEANLSHSTELIGKMNPYCAVIVDNNVFRGQICKKGGKHPHWDDAITVPYTNQNQVIIEVMDKDRFSRDDNIGSFMLNLNELKQTGSASKWYPLTYKNKPAGEILLETTFSGEGFGMNQGMNQGMTQTGYTQGVNQTGYTQGVSGYSQGLNQGEFAKGGFSNVGVTESHTHGRSQVYEEGLRSTATTANATLREEESIHGAAPIHDQHRHIFQESQQVVEPRTFLKEVDVVETRAHTENIEVLEPQKVVKEVQYTQAVPVTKQIEVVEPHVVKKEVEVMEPRLVTKTIQVVENVPVKKQVEVIESVPRMQEVQTFEPQTFTKQIEVTDYVPVTKQVTVDEPVHLKKAVEFVEPVIHTKTITKEVQPAVVVDEKITTTVGPASIIGETAHYTSTTMQGSYQLTEEQRLWREKEYERLRATGLSEKEIEREIHSSGFLPGSHHHQHTHHHGHHDHHMSQKLSEKVPQKL